MAEPEWPVEFEGRLRVQVSGFKTPEEANEMNVRLAAILQAVTEMPGFPGEALVSGEIRKYDPDTGLDVN